MPGRDHPSGQLTQLVVRGHYEVIEPLYRVARSCINPHQPHRNDDDMHEYYDPKPDNGNPGIRVQLWLSSRKVGYD
jgi:hypothetical protein